MLEFFSHISPVRDLYVSYNTLPAVELHN